MRDLPRPLDELLVGVESTGGDGENEKKKNENSFSHGSIYTRLTN